MMTYPNGDIPKDVAEKAELFKCYCGRHMIAGTAAVCDGCLKVPEECKCEELPDES